MATHDGPSFALLTVHERRQTCAKLRVRTRIEAVAVAVRDGIIDPDAE